MQNQDFNFLPSKYIEKEKKRKRKIIYGFFGSVLIVFLIIPAIYLGDTIKEMEKEKKNLEESGIELKERVDKLRLDTRTTQTTEAEIEELSRLFEHKYQRAYNIQEIQKYIPQEIEFKSFTVSASKDKTAEKEESLEGLDLGELDIDREDYLSINRASDGDEDEASVEIYRNIPYYIVIEGNTKDKEAIGRFVYWLNRIDFIEKAEAEKISFLSREEGHSFIINCSIKEENAYE